MKRKSLGLTRSQARKARKAARAQTRSWERHVDTLIASGASGLNKAFQEYEAAWKRETVLAGVLSHAGRRP